MERFASEVTVGSEARASASGGVMRDIGVPSCVRHRLRCRGRRSPYLLTGRTALWRADVLSGHYLPGISYNSPSGTPMVPGRRASHIGSVRSPGPGGRQRSSSSRGIEKAASRGGGETFGRPGSTRANSQRERWRRIVLPIPSASCGRSVD